MKLFNVGIKGCIVKDNRVLLLKKAGEGFWEFPGGRIDDNESIEQTLTRELNEEISNIKSIKIGKIIAAYRLPRDISDGVSLALIYYRVTANITNPILSKEHEAYTWATHSEALELMPDKSDLLNALFG